MSASISLEGERERRGVSPRNSDRRNVAVRLDDDDDDYEDDDDDDDDFHRLWWGCKVGLLMLC